MRTALARLLGVDVGQVDALRLELAVARVRCAAAEAMRDRALVQALESGELTRRAVVVADELRAALARARGDLVVVQVDASEWN